MALAISSIGQSRQKILFGELRIGAEDFGRLHPVREAADQDSHRTGIPDDFDAPLPDEVRELFEQ